MNEYEIIIKKEFNIISLIKKGWILSIYNLNWGLISLIHYSIIGQENKLKVNYIFGIFNSLFCIITVQFQKGLGDIVGIDISKLIGSKKFELIKSRLLKLLFISIIICLFYILIIFNYFYDFLIILGFNKIVSSEIYIFFYNMFPTFLIISINRPLESYILSHNLKYYLFFGSIISYIIFLIFDLFFIFKYNIFINSFIYSKTLQEIFLLIYNIIVIKKKIKYDFKIKIEYIFENFFRTFFYCFKIMFGVIGETLCYEIITIFLAHKNNNLQFSIWIIFYNYVGLLYYFFNGISNQIRNLISWTIGKNQFIWANKLSNYILLKLFIFSYLFGFFSFLFSILIGRIYSDNIEIIKKFIFLNFLYFLLIYLDFINYPLIIILRILKKDYLIIFTNLIIFPISTFFFSYLFVYKLEYGCFGCFFVWILSLLFSDFIFFYGYFKSDWKKSNFLN